MSEVPLEQEELGEIHFTTYLSDDESVQFDSQAMFSVPNDGFFFPLFLFGRHSICMYQTRPAGWSCTISLINSLINSLGPFNCVVSSQ